MAKGIRLVMPILLLKTFNAVAQQIVSRSIKCHAIKQVADINSLSRGRYFRNHHIAPSFDNVHVSNLLFQKHWSDQGPTLLPQLSICSEDAITEEWLPSRVETFTLTKMSKIRGEDRFNMFWVNGHYGSAADDGYFDGTGAGRVSAIEHAEIVFQESVL